MLVFYLMFTVGSGLSASQTITSSAAELTKRLFGSEQLNNLTPENLEVQTDFERAALKAPAHKEALALTKWLAAFLESTADNFENNRSNHLANFFRAMIPRSHKSDSPNLASAVSALHQNFNKEYRRLAESGNLAEMKKLESQYPQIAADNAFTGSIIGALEKGHKDTVSHLLDSSLYANKNIKFPSNINKGSEENSQTPFEIFLQDFLRYADHNQFGQLIDLIKANKQISPLYKNDTHWFTALLIEADNIDQSFSGATERKEGIIRKLYEKYPGVELTKTAFEAIEGKPKPNNYAGDTLWGTVASILDCGYGLDEINIGNIHEQYGHSLKEFQPVPAPF